ncbi:hypothetical protein C7999DRAFT_35100 [Corynascus novoguineensis]|uniref:F-box domain-containing protein n=1 Tax=Corynascus novoguineensis TaxID=1126955 RepID=A0AAN7CLY1_9PEZI|nr:hypothetical protein C7999DRAFT_35100 [Corynascus novoguineensis]
MSGACDIAMGDGPAMNPQLESRLVQMPLEILLRITYFLTTPDLGSVRLTCRALERSLFNSFAHEFFRKKQFMVTTDSLQALIDISQHPTLSPFLKHVIITADRPNCSPILHDVTDTRDNEMRARLEMAYADQMHLLAAGGLRDMLVEAFQSLSNLEVVDLRNFNSYTRYRDGPGAAWTSWGAKTLARSTGFAVDGRPYHSNGQEQYTSQLFAAVIAALAIAQARPKSIEVCMRGRDLAVHSIRDSAFYIMPRLEAPVSSLLANLKTLHLTLAPLLPVRMSYFILQRFLSFATNLTWLRLNFSHPSRPADQENLLAWLALRDGKDPAAQLEAAPVSLAHLERFDLGNASVKPRFILDLVAKFAPTLTSLHLRRVCLSDLQMPLSKDRINIWERCLKGLARIEGLSLRVLQLSQISNDFRDYRGGVAFKTADGGSVQDWTCSADLMSLDKAIAQTIAAMDPSWREEPVSDSDEDDSEEEDEDEQGESDAEGEGGDEEDS